MERVIHDQVLALVSEERVRQAALRAAGKFPYTPDCPEVPPLLNLAMLIEEVGEVARELQAGSVSADRLREELIQVAAIAVAWVEGLLQRGR